MTSERRNDVGAKILIATISVLLGIILAASWGAANDAIKIANNNKVEVSVLKSEFINLKDLICEIKTDVKEIKKAVNGK